MASDYKIRYKKICKNIEMNYQQKTKEELIEILNTLEQENSFLKELHKKATDNYRQKQNLLPNIHNNCKTLFNTITDFLFVLDEEGNIIHINDTVTERLDYTEQELLENSIYMLHPKERRKEAEKFLSKILEGEDAFCTVPIVTKTGKIIPLETRLKKGEWNNKIAIFYIAKDISYLQLSEEKFSKSFHINAAACGFSDVNTHKYIEVNDAFNKLLGFDKGEVIGKSAMDLGILTFEQREIILRNADNKGKISNVEVSLKTKNGSIKHVLLSSENFYVQNKYYRYTSVNDITERKKAEQLILETKNKYQTLVESSPNIILTHTLDGTITYINSNGAEFFSASPDALIGINLFTIFNEEEAKGISENIKDLLAKKVKYYKTESQYKINGKTKIIEIIGVTIRKKNKVEEILVQANDITKRKIAEENLAKSNARLQLSLETNHATVFEDNLETGEMFCTPELFLQFGYEQNEIPSTIEEYIKLVHPDDISGVMKSLNEHLDGDNFEYYAEYRIKDKVGNWHWIDGKGKVISWDENGKPKTLIGISRGIDERKTAEQKLQEKNDQLETIIKGSSLGWWDWNIPSGEEIYNDILVENLGYKLSEIHPHIKWWEDKIHPDDAEQVAADLQQHFDGKTEFYKNKHRLKTKTGQWKWFQDHGKVVERDSEGKAIRMIGTLRDIDFEERAQEKINTSLQQIEMINANIPNIIWKADIGKNGDFQNVYISENADEFYALPKGSIGNSWNKYFSHFLPEYVSAFKQILKKGIENPNKTLFLDYEVKKADGTLAWFSSRGRLISENNKLTVFVSAIDITDQKQAEALLKESEEKFRVLAETAPMGILLYQDFKWIYCNKAAENICGYTFKELKTKPNLWCFVSPEYQQLINDNATNRQKGKRNDQLYEFKIIAKSGQEKWILLRGNNIKLDNVQTGLITVYDITNRKLAEEALFESEQRFKNFSNLTYEGVIIHNNGVIIDFNQAFSRITGYNRNDVIGKKSVKLLIPEEYQEIVFKNMAKDIAEPYEVMGKRKDGELIPLEVQSENMILRKKNVRVTIIRDIARRKKYELQLIAKNKELLEAKEKAEESDQLKSAFLANMSHEIRTPMNGILGFADLLKEPDLNGKERNEFLEIIRKSGERMLDTVNDIIDISKIDSGQMEVSKSYFNVNQEIKDQYDLFKLEALSKGIELKLYNRLSEQENSIFTDKNKLNSIISNLIKNAIKYTDKGSIEIHCNRKGVDFNFCLTDTGIGIPENRLHCIFNRFEQADINDIHARAGSGLGLAITEAYVNMLGGDIGVESQEGKGSTFYFTIPWSEQQQKSALKNKQEQINTVS